MNQPPSGADKIETGLSQGSTIKQGHINPYICRSPMEGVTIQLVTFSVERLLLSSALPSIRAALSRVLSFVQQQEAEWLDPPGFELAVFEVVEMGLR